MPADESTGIRNLQTKELRIRALNATPRKLANASTRWRFSARIAWRLFQQRRALQS